MKYIFQILAGFLIIAGCENSNNTMHHMFLTRVIPDELPIPFNSHLVPSNSLIHRGIFSNDINEYYFTISDTTFSNFTIKVSKKQNGEWAEPIDAFFNSRYNDHGMSFSPDGNTLVFSSTRPVGIEGIPDTWHIWRCVKQNGKWSQPEFIDIPNLRSKLSSHPTLTADGTMYFHAGGLDYSDLSIYYSTQTNGKYQDAKKLNFEALNARGYCTPYISSNGQYLIFAAIGKSLALYVCERKDDNGWSTPTKLPESINQNGQGNPYFTPDLKYLFYASENKNERNSWNVNWVRCESFIGK